MAAQVATELTGVAPVAALGALASEALAAMTTADQAVAINTIQATKGARQPTAGVVGTPVAKAAVLSSFGTPKVAADTRTGADGSTEGGQCEHRQ